MAVNQRVQAATNRVVESCRRVESISDQLIEELEDFTPIEGVPLMDMDEEDSAVIAITEVLESRTVEQQALAGPVTPKRARTEPGIR